jgi:Xaa-Pro dipeptidase
MVITIEPGKKIKNTAFYILGVYFNEALIQSAFNSSTLLPFLNVEKITYHSNFGGVRIEDTILITEDGYQVLSTVPKDLATIQMIMQK